MSDLISKEKLLDDMSKVLADVLISSIRDGISFDTLKNNVMNCIKNQPTAYNVDAVVEQINNRVEALDKKNKMLTDAGEFESADILAGRMYEVIKVREIVEKGGGINE